MPRLSPRPILKAENRSIIGGDERKWTFYMDNYVCLRDEPRKALVME